MSRTTTGRLDRIISIQHQIPTTDAKGHPTKAWQEYAKTWAGVRGLSGREYYAAAAIQSESDVIYIVRYDSITCKITADMQIVDNSVIYKIKSPPVDKDGTRKWLEIRAKMGV
jgi:SPP1 family predicted phage head-tail adaptor